ncbi:MIZ zinc finger protein [Rasamsonia emersonii CBS 393.64]|uniref:MIZ zinc finger protein n=1 Tax=Rasamsonia emersonii (strain ATCC 16479 / CBS 393.64 / IMI 116815) TaxID=1408163 RepID=A0A0F4YPN4_RASE3|nr:MIZ zinc finger protein [Rasamsonia emersonii CBS 393.64]KKA20222.1 MIZ zinc finger protein [Rasamsonia emersonii CBS 393.64]
MASTGQAAELQSVIALVKTLTNAQLKDILRSEGLTVSGVKLSLQLRIIDYLERLYQGGQVDRYDRLKKFIYSLTNRSMPNTPTTYSSHQYHHQSAPHSTTTQSRPSLGSAMPSQPFSTGRLTFKDSPFYTILEPLTSTVECKVREHTRDTVELKVVLNANVAARLQSDPNLRVMVYCAADNGLNQFSKSDIAFPHQVELKANLDEVKANLRGLKNKPGTTRPADITNYIRKKPGYPNNVVMTYALTQKKFFVLVNLVQRHTVDELVAELKARKTISKEQVLRERLRFLVDPWSVRITSVLMPRPFFNCKNKPQPGHALCAAKLRVSNLCKSISKATSLQRVTVQANFVEQVTIEPNGNWYSTKNGDRSRTDDVATSPDDDDLIEIKKSDRPYLKHEQPFEYKALQQTPLSHETSGGSSANRRSSSKRPAPEVIDLTGSDDDDTPSRPTKRQAFDDRLLSHRASQNSFGGNSNNTSLNFPGHDSSQSPGQVPPYYDT